jgi:hypothetical protein
MKHWSSSNREIKDNYFYPNKKRRFNGMSIS